MSDSILPGRQSSWSHTWHGIRNRLVGGTLLLLPIVVTFWILQWCVVTLIQSLIEPVAAVVIWKRRWVIGCDYNLPGWFEYGVAPLTAAAIILAMLYVADLLANSRLRKGLEWLLLNMPVISFIYSPVRKLFQSLEEQPEEQKKPQRIVLVKFPHAGMKVPAFVTATTYDIETKKAILCVYVPTTPVPTSGYFLLVPEDETVDLNWSSEDALQAIISGGLTSPREVRYYGQALAASVP